MLLIPPQMAETLHMNLRFCTPIIISSSSNESESMRQYVRPEWQRNVIARHHHHPCHSVVIMGMAARHYHTCIHMHMPRVRQGLLLIVPDHHMGQHPCTRHILHTLLRHQPICLHLQLPPSIRLLPLLPMLPLPQLSHTTLSTHRVLVIV